MTNMIITPRQRQSACPEDPKFKDNHCANDTQCVPKFEPVKNGNGMYTRNVAPWDIVHILRIP